MFTEADREAVLERAVALLSDDPRIEAVVLTGSLGRGQGDRWSDIDLGAVIANADDVEAVTAEWEALAYREWPVVHHYATEFGTTRVRGFLLRHGLLLDLGFSPIGDFEAWAPLRVILDRTGRASKIAEVWAAWSPTPDWRSEAGFALHDILHACSAANRERRWQSLYFLQRVRNRTLSLASERHGFDADDFVRVDDLPDAETSARWRHHSSRASAEMSCSTRSIWPRVRSWTSLADTTKRSPIGWRSRSSCSSRLRRHPLRSRPVPRNRLTDTGRPQPSRAWVWQLHIGMERRQ
jgi:predicted nucleotidyltransferase